MIISIRKRLFVFDIIMRKIIYNFYTEYIVQNLCRAHIYVCYYFITDLLFLLFLAGGLAFDDEILT